MDIKLQEMELPNGETSFVVDNDGRPLVVAEVNGVNVPFYISTGLGGKEGVATGQWYPIFGISETSGWFNKGSQEQINNFYGNDDLRSVSEWLNKRGDLRGDVRIPKVEDPDLDFSVINRDMNQINDRTIPREQAFAQLQENIDTVARGKPVIEPKAQNSVNLETLHPAITDPEGCGKARVGGEEHRAIAVGHLDKEEALQVIDDMKEMGLNPITKNHPDAGPMILVKGDDIGALENIQSNQPDSLKIDAEVIDAPEKGFFGKALDGLKDMGKSSGFIAGGVIGGVVAGASLIGGASAAEAGVAFVETAAPYGETGIDLIEGDMEAAAKSATVETASNVASIGGMAAGAIAGQMLIPIPVVGAVIGGVIGSIGAGFGAAKATEAVIENSEEKGFWAKLNPFAKDKPEDTKVAGNESNEPQQTPENILGKELGTGVTEDLLHRVDGSEPGGYSDLLYRHDENAEPAELQLLNDDGVGVDIEGFSQFTAYSGDLELLNESRAIGVNPEERLLATADNNIGANPINPAPQTHGMG